MITWNPSPDAITFGSLHIRWYGLFFVAAFLFGYRIMRWIFSVEKVPLYKLDPLLNYLFFGVLIGARLGHTLFYEPGIYLRDPVRILKVWEGGLASHGAVLGVLIALYLFKRRRSFEKSYLWLLDRLTIPVTLGAAFVRLGNLMNSEIVGKPTDLPWAFVFTRVDAIPRHPTQIYEALAYLLVFLFVSWHYWRRRSDETPGFLFGSFLVGVFTLRFFIEFLKEAQVTSELFLPVNFGQLFSIPFILLGIVLLKKGLRHERKRNENTVSRKQKGHR